MSSEINFDGLVGPTHNYAGLSYGNLASLNNASGTSNPRQAAMQGIEKMKSLHDLGFKQGIFAPHARPDIHVLRRLGFTGNDAQVLNKAALSSPTLLKCVYSASSMWTANAATVSPSTDTVDAKVHFTSANVNSKFHRSLEPLTTTRLLKAMFNNKEYFTHHTHLPAHPFFGDEGAANHMRLCDQHGDKGLELFVFGASAFNKSTIGPVKYPARQTYEASHAIARLHDIPKPQVMFIQQNPEVIDQGVFHNDVIAVGNANVLLCHEQAFLHQKNTLKSIEQNYIGSKFEIIEVPTQAISLKDTVDTYMFNSQLISKSNGGMLLVAPIECLHNAKISAYIEKILNDNNSIEEVKYFDLKQSMQNGGGPACLRLRVVLNEDEINAVNPDVMMNDEKFEVLSNWIKKHYRDRLSENDLADPQLLLETRSALDELSKILNLGSVYDFQRN